MTEEEREPTAEVEEAASATAMTTIEHMFEIWIAPELKRRGTPYERVCNALVVLERDQLPMVMINDEFELTANVRATRDLAYAENIYASDFDEVHSIKPVDVGENASWITFFIVPDGLYLAFDFRYELGRSQGVLARADEFLASAHDDLKCNRQGPAVDNALAAAELAVMVQMRTHLAQENTRNRHGSRYTWFEHWTELGNARSQHAKTIRRLEQLRPWARYADNGVPGPRDGEVARLRRDVHELIEDTRVLIRPG
jgi:hypothetical protein